MGQSGKAGISGESLRGNGEVVLVVDDEPPILRLTKEILEKRNYRVLIANDASEALAIFNKQKDSIDAVLTDILMPYMDGIELIRSLKRVRPEVRVIASTGEGEEAHHREFQELGIINFLTKPYDAEKLLTAVRDTLARRD
jgi:CheY-like chemotaxis protein